MDYKAIPFEKRIKSNIRNYALDNLYAIDTLREYCKALHALTGVDILLTERHGEKVVSVGGFAGFTPDVVGEPGRKVRVYGRTIAHLYAEMDKVPDTMRREVGNLLDEFTKMLSSGARRHIYIRNLLSIWTSWKRKWACSTFRQPEARRKMS